MKKDKKPSSLSFLHLLSPAYQYSIVALFAVFVYWNTLNADFVYDDRPAIISNDDVLGRSESHAVWLTNDFWGNPIRLEGSHKSYRPLITVSFRLQFVVHGLKAAWFHAVNLAIHALNSILVMKLARSISVLTDELCFLSAVLFSCHPITSEAVCSVVGRSDLLATTFTLLPILISTSNHHHQFPIVLLSILAVLSKETGVVVLPLVSLHQLVFKGTKQVRNLLNYSIVLGLICYIRLAINNFQSPVFSKNDNPIAHEANFWTRTFTFLYLPVFHFGLMLVPRTLSFDWSMDAIPRIESIFDLRLIGSLTFYTTVLFLVFEFLKKDKRRELFLMALMTAPHLISSNLFTYVGFVAAERILYLPAVGYCILMAIAVQNLGKRIASPLLILLISLHAFRTVGRVHDWKDEESLFRSALAVNPIKAHMNLGYVFTTQNKYEQARFHYLQALRKRPNLADAWYNLGILTSKNPNGTDEAIRCYQQALLSRSNFAAAHLNIALLLYDSGRHQKAFDHLEKCLTVGGENLKSYRNHLKMKASCAFNKGRLYQKIEKCEEAIENFKLALKLGGQHFEYTTSILNSIGSCYSQLGDEHLAEEYFEMAIQENHVNSFLTMAHLKIRQNRSYEVEKLFDKVMELAPESVTVLQNIALAEFHMKNYNRSFQLYQKALIFDENHVESVRGMANLLQETRRHLEAEKFYRKVVELVPDSYEAHSNFGAILHLNQKHEAALKEYDAALKINSNHGITIENREKLIRVMKRRRSL